MPLVPAQGPGLRLGTSIAAGFLVLASAVALPAGAAAQQIEVGPNVHVSGARAGEAHYEIHLAADPADPASLLGASMVWDSAAGRFGVVAYASRDGGLSWTESLDFFKTDYVNDPAVAFGPDGAAYLSAFGADEGERVEMFVHRSSDGGQTWSGVARVPVMDREWISVDRTGGAYHGRIYINGTRGARGIDGPGASGMSIIHSSDGGATFQGPNTLVVSDPLHYVIGMGNSVVLSDGTLVVLLGQWRNRDAMMRPGDDLPPGPTGWLKAVTSTDGGDTFSASSTVADWFMHFPGSMMPYLAADGSEGVFRDRIYAVWADYRSGRGEILLASSRDKGKSWSAPVLVSDDARVDDGERRDHFMPMVAVNRNGVVGVTWYDRRDHPGNTGWMPRFSASLDGGETFLPSVAASTAPFDYSRPDSGMVYTNHSTVGTPQGGPAQAEVVFHGFNTNGGHTAGLAVTADGVFHPFWIDNRTGVPQTWTAAVTVTGQASRHGSPARASLDDVSAKVKLVLSSIEYDPLTGRVVADAHVVNTSKEIVSGPMIVRILSLTSQYGVPALLGADSDARGAGAELDFTSLLVNGRLAPKERTGTRRVEFQLEGVRPLRAPAAYPRGRGGSTIIGISARVLAAQPQGDAK